MAVQKDANILPTVPGILDTCLSLPAAGQAPISKTLGCFQSLDSWEGSPKKTQVRCKYNDKKESPIPTHSPPIFLNCALPVHCLKLTRTAFGIIH